MKQKIITVEKIKLKALFLVLSCCFIMIYRAHYIKHQFSLLLADRLLQAVRKINIYHYKAHLDALEQKKSQERKFPLQETVECALFFHPVPLLWKDKCQVFF